MALANTEIQEFDAIKAEDEKPAMRVLVCEDDPFTLTILKKRLLTGGYTIETATNGREGLEKVSAFKPDLILSDWMMPEMDGVELCSAVKDRPENANIYFILLTAKDKNDDKVSALDTGADEYLVKPCDGRELMARLRAAERLLRLRQELARKNRELNTAYNRIDGEMRATSQIQRSLLPQHLPELAGYAFAAHYQPSTECSGDFYDALPLADGRVALVMGDVSGHGAPAMVAMAMCHVLLHIEAQRTCDPATALFNINNKMFQYLPTDQYATLFYAILDPASGRLEYSSAGHPPPFVLDPKRERSYFLTGCEGFPIKLVEPDIDYETRQTQLEPGQNLILYTDGLIEAFNPGKIAFGMEGLQESALALRDDRPEAMLTAILGDLDRFRGDCPLDDDLSLLIVKRQ
jgi:sigma-B regulation protein RsbU (phosphoserine phosphatase)